MHPQIPCRRDIIHFFILNYTQTPTSPNNARFEKSKIEHDKFF